MLPLWLSPTQVRLIPMSDKFTEKVEEIAKEIAAHCVRVDIDDRASTLQKRVREAEMEWVPYVIVVGAERNRVRRSFHQRQRGTRQNN